MKKRFFLLALLMLIYFDQVWAKCYWEVIKVCIFTWSLWWWEDLSWWWNLIQAWDMKMETWVRRLLLHWAINLWSVFAILAVFWIVYGSFMLVISTWEEEKIKKAKNIVKWSIIWFLAVVTAGTLISIVTNFLYSF